jgi:hypothetical protein
MTDLRAERRAIAMRCIREIETDCPNHGLDREALLAAGYDYADDVIQYDLDNPPEWSDAT